MSKEYRVDQNSKALVYPKKTVTATDKLLQQLSKQVDSIITDVADIKSDISEIKAMLENR